MKKMMAALASLLVIGGCGGTAEQAQEEGTIWRTVVYLRPEGSPEVKTSQVTQAQRRADIAERERMLQQGSNRSIGTSAQAISADPSCAAADLWLFDGYSQGGENELCLFGWGGASLQDYPRFLYCSWWHGCFWGNWEYNVRSYWAGVSGGRFSDLSCAFVFSPWQRADLLGPSPGLGECPGQPFPQDVFLFQ